MSKHRTWQDPEVQEYMRGWKDGTSGRFMGEDTPAYARSRAVDSANRATVAGTQVKSAMNHEFWLPTATCASLALYGVYLMVEAWRDAK